MRLCPRNFAVNLFGRQDTDVCMKIKGKNFDEILDWQPRKLRLHLFQLCAATDIFVPKWAYFAIRKQFLVSFYRLSIYPGTDLYIFHWLID